MTTASTAAARRISYQLETLWDYDYVPTHHEPESLYETAKKNQWNGSTALDWSRPVGYFALRRSIPELPEAWRRYLEDFALRACDAMYGRDEGTGFFSIKHAYGDLGFKDPDGVYAEVLATSMTMKMFNRFLFTEVLIPRLQRLGLISDRVAPRYREIGLIE